MSQNQSKRGGLFGKLFGSDQPAPDEHVAEERGSDERGSDAPQSEVSGSKAPHEPDDAVATATTPDVPHLAKDGEIKASDTAEEPSKVEDAPAPKSWLKRLTSGLTKTSSRLGQGISSLFTQQKLDEATLDDFEDVLIQADLGVETAMRIREQISAGRYDKDITANDVQTVLADEVQRVLSPVAKPLDITPSRKPHVILVVGVNGSGKTTTIGKLASQFKSEGHTVMIAAGDTFRAAAIDQLKVWGERAGVAVVSRDVGADASGLAFDALTEAQANGTDVLLIDTAGRLQNKQALMEELEKIIRVIGKLAPEAPHDTLLVLDATTGQNAISQVEAFQSTAGVTGLIMTKLDGTARGGILVAIAAKFGLPVHAIGIGEGIEDLQPFDAAEFARALSGC